MTRSVHILKEIRRLLEGGAVSKQGARHLASFTVRTAARCSARVEEDCLLG
jgi:hypothetical protein